MIMADKKERWLNGGFAEKQQNTQKPINKQLNKIRQRKSLIAILRCTIPRIG